MFVKFRRINGGDFYLRAELVETVSLFLDRNYNPPKTETHLRTSGGVIYSVQGTVEEAVELLEKADGRN